MAKVVIADDMIMVQHNMTSVLEALGHEVVGVAKNSSEAIEVCMEKKPDLLLLDILGMKAFHKEFEREIDTFDVIEFLTKQNINIKIIMLTATPREEYIKKSLVLGAKGFLVKGVPIEKIEASINGVLQ